MEKELEKSNCKDPKDCKEALTNIDKVYMDYLTSNLHAVMCGKNKLRVYRELKEPQFFFFILDMYNTYVIMYIWRGNTREILQQ